MKRERRKRCLGGPPAANAHPHDVSETDIPPNWDQIVSAYESGRWTEALALIETVIADYAPGSTAHHIKGMVLVKLGAFHAARELLTTQVEANARDASAWFWLSDAYHELKAHDDALRCIDRSIELDPEFSTYRSQKLMILMDMGRWREALPVADDAERCRSTADEVFDRERAEILHHLGRAEEALVASDRVIGTEWESPRSWSVRGAILDTLDRSAEALEARTRSAELAAAGKPKRQPPTP